MVTEKTLTYSHLKTCKSNDEVFKPKRTPKIIRVEKLEQIEKSEPKHVILQKIPQVALTFEDMRRERLLARASQKNDNMKLLFSRAV